ncbi:hypothetical protein J6590_002053 [Homalodisca vitripennis]|nr:hypothetical protein J6590_002053 [Homalodisca vitripennis]
MDSSIHVHFRSYRAVMYGAGTPLDSQTGRDSSRVESTEKEHKINQKKEDKIKIVHGLRNPTRPAAGQGRLATRVSLVGYERTAFTSKYGD